MNGKGDKPRNCFSRQFKDNYDSIDWNTKSSEAWHKELCPKITILDPDGWDRSDFEKSWNERITKQEFCWRLLKSTTSQSDDELMEKIIDIAYPNTHKQN